MKMGKALSSVVTTVVVMTLLTVVMAFLTGCDTVPGVMRIDKLLKRLVTRSAKINQHPPILSILWKDNIPDDIAAGLPYIE